MNFLTYHDRNLADAFGEAFATGTDKICFEIIKGINEDGSRGAAVDNIRPLHGFADEIEAISQSTDFSDRLELLKAIAAPKGRFLFILNKDDFTNMVEWGLLPRANRLKNS